MSHFAAEVVIEKGARLAGKRDYMIKRAHEIAPGEFLVERTATVPKNTTVRLQTNSGGRQPFPKRN